MVTTGGAAGRGCGGGVGCGTGAGRGGIPGGRPAVRQGDPSPRIVGRGNGMIGTPGASGGWVGTGCGAGVAATTAGWTAGWLCAGTALGAERGAVTAFRLTDAALLAPDAGFGRADLMGLALTFEVVVCPFDFERRSELSGATLLTRRCRSI